MKLQKNLGQLLLAILLILLGLGHLIHLSFAGLETIEALLVLAAGVLLLLGR